MSYLLARENSDVLAQLAWSRLLLAFDFDGTLAPITASRDAARMRKRTRDLLARVCTLYPCAVISGRSKRDTAARLEGVAVKYVVGNHGLEPSRGLARFARVVARARPVLERLIAGWPGVELEDKHYSLALHYRRSPAKREALAHLQGAVDGLPDRMRVVPGKLVMNLVPHGAPDKGDAILKVRSDEGADTALYFGDDVTDEDVFEIDQPGRLLGVRVGASRRTAAAYHLKSQHEIDAILQRMIACRASGFSR